MNYKLPYFEIIDITQLEEYYFVEIEKNGQKIGLDLNFEEEEVAVQVFDLIKVVLENIDSEDQKNRANIAADYQKGKESMVKEYLKFHIDELTEELAGIVDFEDESRSFEEQLMRKLKLDRIGFYPDGKFGAEPFVVFDYVVDRSFSDQIVVVNIDQAGKLMHLAWES